jgi:hypothetical protein
MKYSVTGADKKTCEERTIIISAVNEKDAEKQARDMGLLVSVVLDRGEYSGTPDTATPQPPPLENRIAMATVSPLVYSGLRGLATLFWINAVIGYVLGLGCFFVGTIMCLVSIVKRLDEPLGAPLMFYGIGVFIAGMVSHGIAEFFLAFRDLVRNSFHWVAETK